MLIPAYQYMNFAKNGRTKGARMVLEIFTERNAGVRWPKCLLPQPEAVSKPNPGTVDSGP